MKNKKLKKRIASFITAVVMLSGMLPLEYARDINFPHISLPQFDFPKLAVNAEDNFVAINGMVTITSAESFSIYCNNYNENPSFAENHKNDNINLTLTDDTDNRGTFPENMVGLGTSAHPFAGSIIVPDNGQKGDFTFSMNGPLFEYVYDSAKLITSAADASETIVVFKRLNDVEDGTSKPLLAQYVMHNPDTNANSANWYVRLSEDNQHTYSGVIGEICKNAQVNLEFDNQSGNDVINNTDAGIICGKMGSGSSLNLTYTESDAVRTITSVDGNAGGLVGTMEGSAALTINEMPTTSRNITASNGYAGGLVGEMTSESSITVNAGDAIHINSGTVSSALGAGGFCGHYTNKVTASFDLSHYTINTTAVYGQYCGGVFGVLENNNADSAEPIEYTITGTSAGTLTVNSGSDTTYENTGYFGGVIGKYTTDNLASSLILNNLTVNAASQTNFNAFGGAIGLVDSAAYIKADEVNIAASGTDKRTAIKAGECPNYAFFGGLVGATANSNGVFIDLGDFTLSTSESFCGGGVVGQFYNGVLRLSGTTDMTYAKPDGGYEKTNALSLRYSNYGQLVGYNDNVLVYARGNGKDENWTFNRSSNAISDDLGTWGEVVRIPNIETDILTYDYTKHTVTVKSASAYIETPADFVKTALNIQLNKGNDYDCLKFEDKSNSNRDTLLESTITLTADIDLSGTGVNGFMRDGDFDISIDTNQKVTSNINASNPGDVGSFTGKLNGNGKKITLAIGESYGEYTEEQTEGTGQIYRHIYNGLFSVIGNGTTSATVENLTIDGTVDVYNAGPNGMDIGGIAARSHGSTTLNGITAEQTVTYYENRDSSEATAELGKNLGGLIGYVDNNSDNGTIDITGTTTISPEFNFSGKYKNWLMYGGAIGNVASAKVTINFAQNDVDVCTVGMKADISNVNAIESNSVSGGLIGYIHTNGSYANKKVNINNLKFDDCTVGNPASQTGGGFLGYSWYNTYVTIDGLTVTNGTLDCKNSAQNVGVMCYDATGVWKINSLTVSRLTMESGGKTSLGMLVNRAYYYNSNSKVTYGLYLDVLNAGYTLTDSGITLPSSLGIYDELAAYSGDDVLSGGAGVISINMNTDRSETKTRITDTGTYQNQLTSASSNAINDNKYANPYSRYYYNLDVMDNNEPGENLLLWSVNKYVASNIKGEFTATGNPLGITGDNETKADLTGLSFYPIANAGDNTIGNLNLTFDYVTINTMEASMGSDSYARDPSAQNQHYLMQSGLFLNLTEGTTLTINGKLTLNGNFLSVDEYKGVLISNTMNGSLDCSGGSVLLKGIKPSTTESFLLINNITRDSTTSSPLSMKLSNVSTGEGYTTDDTTAKIAKSLIGAVSGPGLSIEFSKIKLDSRTLNNSIIGATTKQISALDTAYNTKNSIFTDSTLIESILSDDTSVLVYNYTFDDDWGTGNRNVTYGKEITDSSEYKGKEKRYYGDDKRWHTNPLTEPNANSEEFNFSEDFLKYVGVDYSSNKDTNGFYNRELKVNVMTVALNVGCGTYNDPYIITDGEQLEAVAKFINKGSTSDLSKVKLPKDSSVFDTLSKNTTGGRWCSDKDGNEFHAIYIPNSNATGYVSSDTSDTEAKTWTSQNVQYYLANAYYKINADIKVKDFPGLGGTAANTAFRGVIVGEKNEDGTPKYTITNSSDYPFINVSNGCVVKDINIAVDKDISLSQTNKGSDKAAFGYVSKCSYYGGMIGEIMGGDNIIDNCYVTFEDGKKVTLEGTYGMLCPVGSYVGVVVFGAIIFKNMDAVKANTNANAENFKVYHSGKEETNLTAETSKGAIYVNPLVGRVINGYAVNETTQFSVTENNTYHDDEGTHRNGTQHSLKNTSKHYPIADINNNETKKLEVSKVPTSTTDDGIINIPNSQALFVLSLITQSLAGTANNATGDYKNSLSYGTNNTVYGMSHNADYTNVGTATDITDSDYVLASGDTATNTAVPYIISRYTNNEIKTVDIYEQFNDEVQNLDGKEFYIYNSKDGKDSNIRYLQDTPSTDKTGCLNKTSDINSAPMWHFEKVNDSTFRIYSNSGSEVKYLKMSNFQNNGDCNLGTTTLEEDATLFTITDRGSGKYVIGYYDNNQKKTYYINQHTDTSSKFGFGGWHQINDPASQLVLLSKKVETRSSSPARCVTKSTDDTASGYYDINLTEGESYQLPDSFRGLGAVGKNNLRYNLKVDVFDGKGCSIDEDIYLNRYGYNNEWYDNYFDKLHSDTDQNYSDSNSNYISSGTNKEDDLKKNNGIGLFNSVFMKDGESCFYNFTLSGSVNTENYKLNTNPNGQEVKKEKNNYIHWLATGGVCGWSSCRLWCNFKQITLLHLTVSGANATGGLLGASGLQANITPKIDVFECGADNLSVEITSEYNADYRNIVGGLVGKVVEGKVTIDGGVNGKIVSLKSISCCNSKASLAGGLVGFAGAGCEVKNMTVCSANENNPVTIGDTSVSMSGGIVGLMQPQNADDENCKATFENCIVSNINVKGLYAGGIYGGTWGGDEQGKEGYNPYSIQIENCTVTGNPTSKNIIEGKNYAGGFVGFGRIAKKGNPNISIGNSKIDNYQITGQYTGGFLGYAHSNESGSSVVCYVYNSAVEYCVLGTGTNNSGGIIGKIIKNNANEILGYNIKLNNVESQSSNMGAWVGYMDTTDKATSIQFTGMAIYGKGFSKNIGNWKEAQNKSNPNTSFVFADYSEKCNENVSANSVKSGLNYSTDNHVDMPRYPYVNVYPQSAIGTGEIISGDGAVLYDTSSPVNSKATGSKTMAAKILNDISNSTISRRYTTFPDAVISDTNTIKYYLERSANDDCNRISTYKTETGNLPEGVDDFAVIVISNSDADETTNLINRYIQLVTNTATDYSKTSSYYEIVLKSCQYENGKFQITTDYPGLKNTSEGTGYKYKLNIDNADSLKQNTFTLVDVQFKDPLNTDKIAYHLYVPVYTVKQMTYTFKASAMTDTKSVAYPHESSSDYENSFGKFHIDSLNTWVTQYIRFTYSKQDMDSLLAVGNLDWNYEKYILLDTQQASYRLPEGTNMILVDPNGFADQTYYAQINKSVFETTKSQYQLDSWSIDLNKFKKDGKVNGDNFEVCTFSEIIAGHITATEETGGAYKDVTNEVNNNSNATYSIYDSKNKKYYLYTSDGTGTYKLTVDGDINEDYYISIYVPKQPSEYNNELYLYAITSPAKLSGKRSAVLSDNKSCNVLIADLFKQDEMTYVVEPKDNDLISVNNPTINVKANSTIELLNKDAYTYLATGVNLYHAFHLLLNRYEADGSVNNEIIGLNENDIKANYSLNDETSSSDCNKIDLQSGYLDAVTTDVLSTLLASTEKKVKVSAEIQMTFYDIEEFPEKISEEGDIGVNVAASSNLAYEQERLSYTSMSTAFSPNDKYYHRESATAARLSYSAVSELDEYDIQGKNSKNFSRLGVNGYSSIGKYENRTAMEIHSKAVFNAASVEEQYFAQAKTVRFSITLWKKTDTKAEDETVTSAVYEQVNDISKYLLGVEFVNINKAIQKKSEISDEKTYVYDMTIEGCNELGPRIYPADIVYYAITGEGFTEYANYKVQIQAELLNKEGKTIGNQPKDYIVYTNAKVFPTVIDQSVLTEN